MHEAQTSDDRDGRASLLRFLSRLLEVYRDLGVGVQGLSSSAPRRNG